MDSNPYAPSEPPRSGLRFSTRFSVGEALSTGWQLFTQRYGSLLAVVGVAVAVFIGIIIINAVLEATDPALAAFVSFARSIFFDPVFYAGVMYCGVLAARGEQFDVSATFIGFRRYWAIVGINVLIALISILAVIPILFAVVVAVALEMSAVGVVVLVLGVLAGIAAGLFIASRLFLAALFCLDSSHGTLGVIESLSASWRATAPFTLRVMGLLVLLMLIVIGSFLLLIVGAIFLGYPLAIAIIGVAYTMLSPPAGTCVHCGYDLRGSASDRCPECGTAVDGAPPAMA